MRAIRLVKSGAALEAQEVPVPNFGSGDVLIRVVAEVDPMSVGHL